MLIYRNFKQSNNENGFLKLHVFYIKIYKNKYCSFMSYDFDLSDKGEYYKKENSSV